MPTINKLYAWSFVIILSGLLILFMLIPTSFFSELENRRLQEAPKFSWEALFKGTFTKEAETYVTDHFPFRDQWVAGKSILEQLRLQQENNGIYRGKDGYLFEKLEEPDDFKLAQYTEAVNQFAERHANKQITFLLAPTSIGLYEDKLPWLAPTYSQRKIHQFIAEQLGEHLTFIDGFDFLESEKYSADPLYYKTDHHWTTHGAYLAYAAYAKHLNWTPVNKQQFHITPVSTSFLGSFHTRSLFTGVQPDTIEVYTPINSVHSELYIADTDTTRESLYDPAFLNKKDQYAYFQGGVHARMQINTTLPKADLDKLLVIKDSYAHNMLPFLTAHVRELHVIDIRFYNGNISRYMEEHQIEDALLLFNSAAFMAEQSLLKLKY